MSLGARCAVVLLAILVGVPNVWAAAPEPAMEVPDVIVDTDVDFDDVAALAYLAEAHRLGLIRPRAVTVAISGFALAGEGLSHTLCLFRKLRLAGVPVSDGDRLGVHAFPAFIHELVGPIVEQAVQPSTNTPCPAASMLIVAGYAGGLAVAGRTSVSGRFSSVVVAGPTCTSPVSLCTEGALTGGLKGSFSFIGTSLIQNDRFADDRRSAVHRRSYCEDDGR